MSRNASCSSTAASWASSTSAEAAHLAGVRPLVSPALWASLFGKRKEAVDLDKPPVSTAHLRTQLFRTDYFGVQAIKKSGGTIASRSIAPGLIEAIVEDLGSGERTLSWDALATLGSDRDYLFALARQQAAAGETQIESTMIADSVQVIASNGFYLSAYLLDMFTKRAAKHGILFAPVSWHHWCVHIIQPMSVAPIVDMMRLVAEDIAKRMKCTDSETLTGDLLWFKPNGVIEKLDATVSPELAQAFENAFQDGMELARRG